MNYSVIIPVYNEQERIVETIRHLRAFGRPIEIVVADGTSSDKTRYYARPLCDTLCISDRGRGTQCNAGADAAEGDVFLFLRVDTRLPSNAFALLDDYFGRTEVQCGSFRLSFDSNRLLMRLYAWCTRFDTPLTRFGDQCIVLRRSFFYEIGGFAGVPLCEDVGLFNAARKKTKIHSFPAAVTTSARAFTRYHGIGQQLMNARIMLCWYLGVSPYVLYRMYTRANCYGNGAVAVFAKYPRKAEVKTRLAAKAGADFALWVYTRMLRHICRCMRMLRRKTTAYCFYTGAQNVPQMRRICGRGLRMRRQTTASDLGSRMAHAFSVMFSEGASHAVVVGSDIPGVDTRLLHHALDALSVHDVVIGPAYDGGYYCIGMRRLYDQLFTNMPWSTPNVFDETVRRCRGLALSLYLLDKRRDIDTIEDIRTWLAGQDGFAPSCMMSRGLRKKLMQLP